MFHERASGSVCKCNATVRADTTDDSERSESTQCLSWSIIPKKDERLQQVTRAKHYNDAPLNIYILHRDIQMLLWVQQ